MKADLAKREPEVLKKSWEDLYHKIRLAKKGKPKFILHDGPPYANGPIHLGHALNKILKDIIIKAKTLSDYDAPYIPGWDCHGLPIELGVEKKYGKGGVKISKVEFIQKCREYASQQIEIQKNAFIRLGVMGDWQNHYATMNPKYEANIIRFLAEVIDNGYLEKGYKPVHWCTACGSALAEAEVEYQDKTSPAIDVRFRLLSLPKIFAGKVKMASVPIWTTTPWTLPANEAVALNANIKYVLVDCGDFSEPLLIAEGLLLNCMQRYGVVNYKIITKCLGKDLENPTDLAEKTFLQHPFLDQKIPLIVGEHVTVDVGTGAVHTAPAHGQEDFKIAQEYAHKYKKYQFAIFNPVDSNGCFAANTPFFAGEHVFKANDHVIAVLKEKGNLIHAENLSHSYPHCWRHKTPLIFRATPQWFVSMDKSINGETLRDQSQNATAQMVQWIPSYGKERMLDMLNNRPDWCISRQRLYGTPMAMFIHRTTEQLHPRWRELMSIVANQVEQEGIAFWHNLNAEQFLKQHAPEYVAEDYIKVTDTLDVWFDAGVSHHCVLNQEEFPANLYLEGSDQYRGWFQSSLLTSVAINHCAPYKQVVTHGFTVDEKGHKMSKSLGNVIDPQKIIETNGADILRLWVASVYYPDDMVLSEEVLKGVVDIYRRIRNTVRYLISNLYDFDPRQDLVEAKKMLALDLWAVRQALQLQNDAKISYEKYEFYTIYDQLRTFASTWMGNYYLDIIKDRLYTTKTDGLARRSAQTALYHILEILVRILAPIISFTAEEVWQCMREQFAFVHDQKSMESGGNPTDNNQRDDGKKSSMQKHFTIEREESVFLTTWYNLSKNFTSEITDDNWANIYQVRMAVYKELEKLRIEGKIGSGLDAKVQLFCDVPLFDMLKKLQTLCSASCDLDLRAQERMTENSQSELRFILITSEVEVFPEIKRPQDANKAENLDKLWIKVVPSEYAKCARCWHHSADVGVNHEHPTLCGRCVNNLFGSGEERKFA